MIHARIQEFSSGGGGRFYFILFFSPQHILQKSSGYFQRKLLFAKVQVGVDFFPGG